MNLPTPEQLNWQTLMRLPWLAKLAACPQDPEFHGEGDVLTHTKMVVEALLSDRLWQQLPAPERLALFWAALLHDVAKPATTVIEDGRIRSPGHAVLGAKIAQELLWLEHGLSGTGFALRQTVVRLVRWHGLPLFFLEREQPERRLIEASLGVRLDLLSILAHADVRGRICQASDDLQTRLGLFQSEAEDLGCWQQPYAFANALSRFRYFHSNTADRFYAAFEAENPDQKKSQVVLLVGLPGSGKDTWAATHCPDWPVVSLDALRQELRVKPGDNLGQVLQLARERAREYLRRGQNFIWNATNIVRSLRVPLVGLFSDYGAKVKIVYVERQLDTVLRQNHERPAEQQVPEPIIVGYARRLEVPDLTEAHEVEYYCE
jgi:putative nucleotidyltransferase with HDIG domain